VKDYLEEILNFDTDEIALATRGPRDEYYSPVTEPPDTVCVRVMLIADADGGDTRVRLLLHGEGNALRIDMSMTNAVDVGLALASTPRWASDLKMMSKTTNE
jgi:hypothetical protein